MARKKYEDKLVKQEDIFEEMKLIEGSETDYITPSGQIYKDYGNGFFFPKKNTLNKENGYLYCGITMADGNNKQFRIHILVAKAYIPNPQNLPYVCHKDDNKQNCCAENLEWGSASKNTKDAYDRGLAKNASGYEDSQSMPVCCFDLQENLIAKYGSVSLAAKATGLTKTGILYQCNHKMKSKPRKGYYFRFQEEYNSKGFVL
jgi:hypothetical protein